MRDLIEVRIEKLDRNWKGSRRRYSSEKEREREREREREGEGEEEAHTCIESHGGPSCQSILPRDRHVIATQAFGSSAALRPPVSKFNRELISWRESLGITLPATIDGCWSLLTSFANIRHLPRLFIQPITPGRKVRRLAVKKLLETSFTETKKVRFIPRFSSAPFSPRVRLSLVPAGTVFWRGVINLGFGLSALRDKRRWAYLDQNALEVLIDGHAAEFHAEIADLETRPLGLHLLHFVRVDARHLVH